MHRGTKRTEIDELMLFGCHVEGRHLSFIPRFPNERSDLLTKYLHWTGVSTLL